MLGLGRLDIRFRPEGGCERRQGVRMGREKLRTMGIYQKMDVYGEDMDRDLKKEK